MYLMYEKVCLLTDKSKPASGLSQVFWGRDVSQ